MSEGFDWSSMEEEVANQESHLMGLIRRKKVAVVDPSEQLEFDLKRLAEELKVVHLLEASDIKVPSVIQILLTLDTYLELSTCHGKDNIESPFQLPIRSFCK